MPMSPADRDYMIRTIIGEAQGQPEEGLAAVGHVIMNRVNSGKFGKTPQEVVLAPNQFEPWSTRAKELRSIDPKSPEYQSAAKIVDGIAEGRITDPTGGATHFLQPDIVRARGTYQTANGLPDWAQGNSKRIGAHAFYSPDNASWEGDDLLTNFHPERRQTAQAGNDLLGAFGTKILKEGMTPNKPSPIGMEVLKGPIVPDKAPVTNFLERMVPGITSVPGNMLESAMSMPGALRDTTRSYFDTGKKIKEQGAQEVSEGNLLPTGAIGDPSKWQPGGILNYLRGGIAQYGSPAFAGVKEIVQNPATKATGNSDFGEKAAMLVPLPIGRGGARTANATLRPTSRASSEILERLPDNKLDEALTRMKDNPRLSLVDVAPEVRVTAQGMIDPAQPKASSVISSFAEKRKKESEGAVKDVYNTTLGKASDPLERLDKMKTDAQEVGHKLINPAVEGAGPVDITGVVKHIEKEIGPYAMKYIKNGKQPPFALSNKQQKFMELRERLRRDQFNEKGDKVFMDAPLLHEIQSEWRVEAEGLGSSSVGSERLLSEPIRGARDKLVDSIDKAAGHTKPPKDHTRLYMGENDLGRWYTTDLDKAKSQGGKWGEVDVPDTDMALHFKNPQGSKSTVPAITDNGGAGTPLQQQYFNQAEPVVGAYKKGLNKYREAKQIPEAFERGLEIERNRPGITGIKEDRPEAWRKWVKEAPPKQLEAAQDAALLAIEHHIEQVKNHARKGMDIPENNFVGDKIKILFGEEKGSKLLQRLRDERDISDTNTKLIGGSKTAETLAGKESMQPREVGTSGNIGTGITSIATTLGGMALGFPSHGAIAGGALMGGKFLRDLGQKAGRYHDLARNEHFARGATATGENRNALIEMLEKEAAKRHSIAQGNKLSHLLSSPIFRSLPR